MERRVDYISLASTLEVCFWAPGWALSPPPGRRRNRRKRNKKKKNESGERRQRERERIVQLYHCLRQAG